MQDELLAPHKNVHDACARVTNRCVHTVRPSPRTIPPQGRPSPTAEAALVRYPSRARRCRYEAFSHQMDCFQQVGSDFRVSLHLDIDVPGAENYDLLSSCANLAADSSRPPGWWRWMPPLRRTRGTESPKKSPFLHGKGHMSAPTMPITTFTGLYTAATRAIHNVVTLWRHPRTFDMSPCG